VSKGVSAAEAGALMHGPTYMGNPLAAAVSLASIRLLLSQPWQERVAGIERGLMHALQPASGLSSVADVRVLGAIGVVATHTPLPVGPTQELLFDRGVWRRPFDRLLYTMPPYICTDEEVDRIGAAMVAGADELA
jgi:adenosylmethionine-8-amino-7-oxononanoate aminotransferase